MTDARVLDFDRLDDQAMWQAFAPQLHVADTAVLSKAAQFGFPPEQDARVRELMRTDGYFHAYRLDWGFDIASLAETVRGFGRAGVPPIFAFLYDEFWLPFRMIAPILASQLGGPHVMQPDFRIWDIDPARGDIGEAPRRDRGAAALFPDSSPKSLTVWIPLTPATPLTSCMYVVPAGADRGYGRTEGDGRFDFEIQAIRALPAAPGDFIMWNQAVIHWGSRSSTMTREPQVSMAVAFQRADVAPMQAPLIDPAAVLPFEARLHLILAQVLGSRTAFPPAIEKIATAVIGRPAP